MKQNKHIIIFVGLFIALVVFEYMQPKPVDWSVSFSKNQKIPYGSYIIYDLLEDIFKDSQIEVNTRSPFITLTENDYKNTSYIIINQEFKPANVNLESLLDFASKGNKVFVSALQFSEAFKDSLNFNTKNYYSAIFKNDSLNYNFFNQSLKTDSGYFLKSLRINYYINSVDTNKATKIAYVDDKKTNFFRQKYGKGEFFIHTQPFAFTNYNLLQDSILDYSLKTFAFVNNDKIIWDEYSKPGKYNGSPMSYIISQDALRKSWHIILALIAVFLILGSKRKQKIIPVIMKPANSSLEFTKTLANLYLNGKNHKDIAQKKYYYWLNYLRRKYLLQIDNNQKLDIALISEKTGVDQLLIKKIEGKKQYINMQERITPATLLAFNEDIDEFYLQNK